MPLRPKLHPGAHTAQSSRMNRRGLCTGSNRKERQTMTYVVCEPCRDCKYTDCVVVCPVDCFYQDESQLYIDPTECIDCGGCVPECPVEAIFLDTDVPAQWVQ